MSPKRRYIRHQTARQRQRLMTLIRIVYVGIVQAVRDEKKLTRAEITAKNKRLLAKADAYHRFPFVEMRHKQYASDVIKELAKCCIYYYRYGTTPLSPR